jgi:hypothetical protein
MCTQRISCCKNLRGKLNEREKKKNGATEELLWDASPAQLRASQPVVAACHLATPPLERPPSRGRAVGELEGRARSEEAATASASSGFRSASSSGHEEPREAGRKAVAAARELRDLRRWKGR